MDRPDDDGPNTRSRLATPGRLGGYMLAAALGLGVGWWWRSASIAEEAPFSAMVVPLQIWLASGRSVHALDTGRIALPTGSKFKLRIQSTHAGRLSIYALDRVGRLAEAPLITVDIFAGKVVDTAELSMSGSPGAEQLRVIVAALDGSKSHMVDVAMWHYVPEPSNAAAHI